jgi:hypothetical protein
LRKVSDASGAFSADATFFASQMWILKPQYGQVFVFCSALAIINPLHLLHTAIRKDIKPRNSPKTFSTLY